MRTKTLLLTAAIVAVGISATVAQTVYSRNAVGYVNKQIGANYSIISNPLNGTNNNLSTILPNVPDNTLILKWDPATQSFATTAQFIDQEEGWQPPNVTLSPGEGAFINVPTPTTLTFVGEVPQGNLSLSLSANYNLISQMTPQTNGLSTVGFPASPNDLILFWDNASQSFSRTHQYIDDEEGWLPSDPAPALAEGFFLNTQTPRSWNRTFNVN